MTILGWIVVGLIAGSLARWVTGARQGGCLITIGYPKFGGGVGGYARFVAICPAEWGQGVRVGEVPEAPLLRSAVPLRWDSASGMRVRR